MDEFALIERYFSRATDDRTVLVGVGDDGAVVRPDSDRDVVTVVDTLVEGIHFPASLPATDVGWRAAAVNLSDIAAMGARPRWMTLALTLQSADEAWIEGFAAGLYEAADAFGISLIGGDTTRGPAIVVSLNLIGDVPRSQRVLRRGAMTGDRVFVTGTVGDAAAGLRVLEDGMAETADTLTLASRFARPVPRVEFGQRLAEFASAAIDLSDGLYADLGKLLSASACAARIDVDRLPLSAALTAAFGPDARRLALSGGDDYEICLTLAADREALMRDAASQCGVEVTCIGTVTSGEGIDCYLDGEPMVFDDPGYRHFGTTA